MSYCSNLGGDSAPIRTRMADMQRSGSSGFGLWHRELTIGLWPNFCQLAIVRCVQSIWFSISLNLG